MTDMDKVLAELLALRAELRALRSDRADVLRPVLSVSEASQLVGAGSASAFHRWTILWRVAASARGRYARQAVLAGLQREVNASGRKRRRRSVAPLAALQEAAA